MTSATITTAAVDRLMAKPADLVARNPSLSVEQARGYVEDASTAAAGREGLRFPPWRQSYDLRLEGSDLSWLLLYAKPVEAVTVTDANGVAVTDFTISSNGLGIPDRVERDGGWGRSFGAGIGISLTEDADSELTAWLAAVTEGWLMPGQVSTWAASTPYKAVLATTSADDPDEAPGTPYARGSWVRSVDPRVVLRFECTTSGTSGASEPVAFTDSATKAGDTIADDSVTWTARAAFELPADLSRAVLNLAAWLASPDGREVRSVKRREASSSEIEYFSGAPSNVLTTFQAYR
jgi:hypothetical protein